MRWFLCPEEATEDEARGFNPGNRPTKTGCREWAKDHVGRTHAYCYLKWNDVTRYQSYCLSEQYTTKGNGERLNCSTLLCVITLLEPAPIQGASSRETLPRVKLGLS